MIHDYDSAYLNALITPRSRPLTPAVRAVADALPASAAELPGFVQHDRVAHAILPRSVPDGRTPMSTR